MQTLESHTQLSWSVDTWKNERLKIIRQMDCCVVSLDPHLEYTASEVIMEITKCLPEKLHSLSIQLDMAQSLQWVLTVQCGILWLQKDFVHDEDVWKLCKQGVHARLELAKTARFYTMICMVCSATRFWLSGEKFISDLKWLQHRISKHKIMNFRQMKADEPNCVYRELKASLLVGFSVNHLDQTLKHCGTCNMFVKKIVGVSGRRVLYKKIDASYLSNTCQLYKISYNLNNLAHNLIRHLWDFRVHLGHLFFFLQGFPTLMVRLKSWYRHDQ